ncbi:MAG: Uma2 family endonuclease [Leptolyngbyaceae cyanobacterium RU_5_1]|nr:Uma2 family endonuclease [Leptolyngbyaceae cyanobacterium RU_5_1]
MTQAKLRFATFEDYLNYDDGTDRRYELVDGRLVELPPESEPNDWIANYLFLAIANTGVVPPRLIRPGKCEIQVPVLQPNDPANRYPDLVILCEVHLTLTQKRLTIKRDMPPPVLVAEVVSPGKTNRERDDERKRDQYAQLGIPEYWLIDPEQQRVTVLELKAGHYAEVGTFQGSDAILSPTFSNLQLTANQILTMGM